MRTKFAWIDREQRDMILHPRRWPKWPYLPMKRVSTGEFGTIWAGELSKHCIIVRMVEYPNVPKYVQEWREVIGYQYRSVEDLLDDDWMVD